MLGGILGGAAGGDGGAGGEGGADDPEVILAKQQAAHRKAQLKLKREKKRQAKLKEAQKKALEAQRMAEEESKMTKEAMEARTKELKKTKHKYVVILTPPHTRTQWSRHHGRALVVSPTFADVLCLAAAVCACVCLCLCLCLCLCACLCVLACRYANKIASLQQELQDTKEEFDRHREVLMNTVREQTKETKLLEQLIALFLPSTELGKVWERAVWDEEAEEWTLPTIKPRKQYSQVVKLPTLGGGPPEQPEITEEVRCHGWCVCVSVSVSVSVSVCVCVCVCVCVHRAWIVHGARPFPSRDLLVRCSPAGFGCYSSLRAPCIKAVPSSRPTLTTTTTAAAATGPHHGLAATVTRNETRTRNASAAAARRRKQSGHGALRRAWWMHCRGVPVVLCQPWWLTMPCVYVCVFGLPWAFLLVDTHHQPP